MKTWLPMWLILGLQKCLTDGESIAYTKTLATFGYVAPEYGLEGQVSTRCDIYSYGIMLMEIFTRTKPNNEMFSEISLRSWISSSMPNALDQIVDANLPSQGNQHFSEKLECIKSIMRLAIACTEESPRDRINAIGVLAALKKIQIQLLAYCESM
ncbi:hypothetical protein ACH5RR_040435 [Cinchona calisaya]|uniref:Protein kinase domain-containing protein n=1 Tax=Cinchona calisaya TaxID=153742 RepID=A0ABD2XW38_9GENT